MRFSEFITLQRGFDLPKSQMKEGPYPVIGSTSIIGYHDRFKALPPGVVTGRSGSLGTVQYINQKYWPHNTSLWVKDFKGNDPRYVYYQMKGMDFARFNAGAGVPTLNRNHLDSLEVDIPPLGIQKRIVEILSAYDDLIDNNLRRIQILELLSRNLYREWFSEFRFPGHEDSSIDLTAPNAIPEGWVLKKLSEVADVIRGRSYRSVDLADDGGLPFINLKCFNRDGGFRRNGIKRYTGAYGDHHVARKGDILIAVTDMTQERRLVARAALVPSLDKEFGIFSMDLVRLQLKDEFPTLFLYSFLRYSGFADQVKHYANGANVLHLSPERISEYLFLMPTTELIDSYLEKVAPVFELINVLENKIDNLRLSRDALMPRLLSGEINILTE